MDEDERALLRRLIDGLPEELRQPLVLSSVEEMTSREVAEAMGISNPEEAATVGLAEWVSRRKSELDDRDPNEKYEVNEALDELLEKKK